MYISAVRYYSKVAGLIYSLAVKAKLNTKRNVNKKIKFKLTISVRGRSR